MTRARQQWMKEVRTVCTYIVNKEQQAAFSRDLIFLPRLLLF